MDVIPLRPTAIQGLAQAGNASQDKLAEGRIFAAQVLQLLDGGSVVLGVGRERIAATSQAALQLGQKLFLKVRGSGTSTVLELVAQDLIEAGGETGIGSLESTHPFRWLARGQGVGELLAELARALSARGEAAPAAAGELARSLDSFAFAPGGTGAELSRHLSSSGLSHEALRLGRALEGLPQPVLASAAEELIALAFAALEVAEEIGPARRALGEELARLLTNPAELARLGGKELAAGDRGGLAGKALGAWIAQALDQGLGSSVSAEARARIATALMLARISPRLAAAVLEALLGEHAPLARALDEATAANPKVDRPDLKQWLATAMESLEPGPERAALRAAYDALEAEQFVALARASHGEGSSWVFALRDGPGFADARLLHRGVGERESTDEAARGGRIERAVLGIEFSRTGPVRAEFVLDGNALHVRLGVSREDVAAILNASLGELSARLQAAGKSVHVSVGVRAAEDLRVPGPELDARLGEGRPAIDRLG